jgi:hypothetical protein
MEPEVLILCLQELSTGPYPEPYQSNPHHRILSLLRSIFILSTHLRLVEFYTQKKMMPHLKYE